METTTPRMRSTQTTTMANSPTVTDKMLTMTKNSIRHNGLMKRRTLTGLGIPIGTIELDWKCFPRRQGCQVRLTLRPDRRFTIVQSNQATN